MRLLSINLENFRSYKKKSIKYGTGLTVIVGDNASGKTNILEACYLLASGKSFRAQKVDEMISFNEELGRVGGVVRSSNENVTSETRLDILLTRGELQGKRVAKRRYSVDGANKRIPDFIGRLVAVLFRPEDLQIILGRPTERREFLDGVLGQIDREYRRSLYAYEKALRRRNRILDAIRDEGVPRTQLTFWDQMLIKHGTVLTEKRRDLIEAINKFKSEINSFQMIYQNSSISEKRLMQYAQQEIAVGYTLVGPHKDDFVVSSQQSIISSQDRDLAIYGSRGEQRLAVLWLKLAELEYVEKRIGEKPVLILDDIFSELDEDHREMVLKVISKQQTILTTTDLDLIESRQKEDYQLINLS